VLAAGWSPETSPEPQHGIREQHLRGIRADPQGFLKRLTGTNRVVERLLDGTPVPPMREVVYWISDGEFSGVISLRCLRNSGEPDRLVGIASVDLSRPMFAIRELRCAVGDLRFRGLRLLPWLWNPPPDDRRFYPLYAGDRADIRWYPRRHAPKRGSTQTATSGKRRRAAGGQGSCACCSVRNAVRTGGDLHRPHRIALGRELKARDRSRA
jgi:hypothetical protein